MPDKSPWGLVAGCQAGSRVPGVMGEALLTLGAGVHWV